MVGEELGLVGGHVDVGRAVGLAALAGQAQVERVLDRVAAPAVGDRGVAVAVEHLEQQPRPAPGRVLFLQGDLVRGAHDRAAVVVVVAALADAHAAVGGLGERAAVVRVAEEQVLRGGGRPVAAELEVLVEPGRVDDLARVHLVARVEDLLELAERGRPARRRTSGAAARRGTGRRRARRTASRRS